MENIDYRKLVLDIQKQIETLEIEQEEVSRKLARLRQSLVGLVPLAEEQELPDSLYPPVSLGNLAALLSMGMTDSVRQLLQASGKPLSPTQIKEQLVSMGEDFSKHKNAMASIHSLIKRLKEADEIQSKDGGLTYEWKWRILPTARKRFDPNDPTLDVNKSGMRGMK